MQILTSALDWMGCFQKRRQSLIRRARPTYMFVFAAAVNHSPASETISKPLLSWLKKRGWPAWGDCGGLCWVNIGYIEMSYRLQNVWESSNLNSLFSWRKRKNMETINHRSNKSCCCWWCNFCGAMVANAWVASKAIAGDSLRLENFTARISWKLAIKWPLRFQETNCAILVNNNHLCLQQRRSVMRCDDSLRGFVWFSWRRPLFGWSPASERVLFSENFASCENPSLGDSKAWNSSSCFVTQLRISYDFTTMRTTI